ncbi:MAG TPA: hypothetical protein VG675_01990 [Bryobacteraceae bacterium]|nr:hypothetical protein [Bryobacteraceae bacterium]
MRTLILLLGLTGGLWAGSAAGLQWTAPPGWKDRGSRPMRASTYIVSNAAGDHEAVECVVYFFGAGEGGSIEANLARWKGQFRNPKGGQPEAQVRRRSVHGLPVTTIDISGLYSGMGGPMAAPAPAKPDYRLLGAIIQGPGGNLFVKFAGPAHIIAANQQKFEQLLGSFEKSGNGHR